MAAIVADDKPLHIYKVNNECLIYERRKENRRVVPVQHSDI
jgi:hypothetical protein